MSGFWGGEGIAVQCLGTDGIGIQTRKHAVHVDTCAEQTTMRTKYVEDSRDSFWFLFYHIIQCGITQPTKNNIMLLDQGKFAPSIIW